VNDEAYLNGPYLEKVQKRGAEIISVMGKSSAASAANAACDHIHDWWFGTKPGCHVSMAVISDGNTYGAPAGIMFSFPCTVVNGEWKIVDGLAINDFSKGKLAATAKELLEERKMALNL
jgi:malate dehydrogenase